MSSTESGDKLSGILTMSQCCSDGTWTGTSDTLSEAFAASCLARAGIFWTCDGPSAAERGSVEACGGDVRVPVARCWGNCRKTTNFTLRGCSLKSLSHLKTEALRWRYPPDLHEQASKPIPEISKERRNKRDAVVYRSKKSPLPWRRSINPEVTSLITNPAQ